ncbi:MAG: VOC family protein [Proteobacteria bacterium]|nr:VOC family protein [Pseudomonadota bacterium]
MKLATLMVLVPDLDEAEQFYVDALGFRRLSRDETLLRLDHEGAPLHVFRCEAPAPPARHGRTAASVFVFGVDDLDGAMVDLRAKGVRFIHDRPATSAFGRYAAFHAPGGNVHEIFEAAPLSSPRRPPEP